LADAIIKMAHDKSARESMGRCGQAFVHEEFETSQLCGRVEQIYQRVVSRRLRKAA
jgi:glycosyltransferase involved in cell wall biosynthesis